MTIPTPTSDQAYWISLIQQFEEPLRWLVKIGVPVGVWVAPPFD